MSCSDFNPSKLIQRLAGPVASSSLLSLCLPSCYSPPQSLLQSRWLLCCCLNYTKTCWLLRTFSFVVSCIWNALSPDNVLPSQGFLFMCHLARSFLISIKIGTAIHPFPSLALLHPALPVSISLLPSFCLPH